MTVPKALPKDLIDSLLSGYQKPEDLIGEHGLLKQLTNAVIERALHAEMEAHLGHAKNEPVVNAAKNTRNDTSQTQTRTANRTKGITLRMTPAQFNRLHEVFCNSKFKSKQIMAEELLFTAIENLAKELNL